MRPVSRGDAPPDAHTYEDMRRPLRDRLGKYCSYCEYPLKHVPHAEHVVPKDLYPDWRDRWDNLLLSCTYCNGHKGHERPSPGSVDEYLWPSRDNTALAFDYANIFPNVADGLTGAVRNKAAMLRGLVDLGLTTDDRATERSNVFIVAQHFFSRMSHTPDRELAEEAVIRLALATGFFSVWMEIFASLPSVRARLIEAFTGTARDCFDPDTCQPVPRPGGRM